MYQNYIFDLYGTLVDIHTDEEQAAMWEKLVSFFKESGAVYEPEELKKRYCELVTEQEDALALASGVPRRVVEIKLENVFRELFAEKDVAVSEEHICNVGLYFRNVSTEYIKLFPGVKELLLRLKKAGKGVYLLSNAQRIFTEPEMRDLEIYDLFDGILYSSDAGVKKPSPLFFDALMKEYGLVKEESVMIGNDCNADIAGAHDYGLASMYVHTNQSTPLTKPLPSDCRRLQEIGEAF